MNNLFLTGKIGVGKSTILKEILERINASIGGYITERVIQGSITTFVIRSLYDYTKKHNIANIDKQNNYRKVFIKSFDTELVSILDNSLNKRDFIVLDELGFMENDIDKFTSKVYELLDSEKPVFGVLKDYDCNFLNTIRSRDDLMVIRITEKNRDTIIEDIVDILKSFGVPFKEENSFRWSDKRIKWYNESLEHPTCSYPHTFIQEIKEHTGNLSDKNIIDIGAGTGAFAIPLISEGANITVIDSSFNMMDSLVNRAEKHGLYNLNCIISPFHRVNLDKHHIAISTFSGGSTKTLEGIEKMYNLVDEYCFIISSFEKQENNFKRDILYEMLNRPPSRKRTHKNSLMDTLKILGDLGYKYEYKEMEYEHSQYFQDFNEALDFFTNRYAITEHDEIQITKKFLNDFLIKVDNIYLFENIKKSWFITIKTKF